MTSDLYIWQAGSAWNYLSQVRWSRSWITVQGQRIWQVLDSQALTLCVQMPVLIFALDGQTEEFPNNAAGTFVLLILYRAFS